MKRMIDEDSKRWLGIKVGLVVLAVFCFGFFAFTAWGLPGDYEGSYSGTYSGDDNGIWIAYITNTGYMRFITWSNDYESVDGGEDFVGTNGEIDLFTDDGTSVTGDIDDVNFDIDGDWVNGADGGTISGTQQDAAQVAQYAGNYSGEFCGDDSGTWDFTVETTGYISGSVDTSGGVIALEGGINEAGKFIVFAYGENAAVRGTISSSGNVTGYWRSEDDDANGWVSNTGTCGPTNDGGGTGGGGGGCFISILN